MSVFTSVHTLEAIETPMNVASIVASIFSHVDSHLRRHTDTTATRNQHRRYRGPTSGCSRARRASPAQHPQRERPRSWHSRRYQRIVSPNRRSRDGVRACGGPVQRERSS